MKKKFFLIVLFSFFGYSQTKFYKQNFFEGKSYLMTMNQSNDLMLNALRLIGNEVDYYDLSRKNQKRYFNIQCLFTVLIGQALTHEEGHRSVLSELGIGSVNKPFFDKNFVAKVTGVYDETLMNLRDNDLPSYIRLHTAGLESDYAYLKKEDALFNFKEETYGVLYGDYLMRKLASEYYYLTLLFKSKVDIKETDDNELDRDIVGHDLYGMIRHLHRPTMEFYRYTDSTDLTPDEISFVNRMGFMSLLNFLNPNIFRSGNYILSNNIVANFSVNYSLSPFGDFTEQNVYLTIKDKYKINPYFRQYFNKSNTFLAGGINFHNYAFHNEMFLLNSSFDFWEQPKDLEFRTDQNQFGFGIKSELALRFSNWNNNKKSAYFNVGASYKTDGFIPETPSLKEDFNVYLGIVLSVNQ
jgi:hypothetical protein